MFSYIFITIVINRNMTIFIVSEVRVKTLLAPSLQIQRQTDTMQYLGSPRQDEYWLQPSTPNI